MHWPDGRGPAAGGMGYVFRDIWKATICYGSSKLVTIEIYGPQKSRFYPFYYLYMGHHFHGFHIPSLSLGHRK